MLHFEIKFTMKATPALIKAVEAFINKLAKLGPLPALTVALEEETNGDQV